MSLPFNHFEEPGREKKRRDVSGIMSLFSFELPHSRARPI